MKKQKRKVAKKKIKIPFIPGHAISEEEKKRAVNNPTKQMEDWKERSEKIEKSAKEAHPITYQRFDSVNDTPVRENYRRTWDWRTGIIPRFSKPLIVENKTDAPVFVPATFKIGTSRKTENVMSYNMIVVDVDNEKLNKKGRPIDHHHPLGVYSMLEGKMEFFIYTTYSNINKTYTDTKPREVNNDWHAKFRVMIPLATPITMDFYVEAKPYLKSLFKYADNSTFNPVQPFNVPCIQKGNEYNFSCYHGKGPFLELNDHYGKIKNFKTEAKIKLNTNALATNSNSIKDTDLAEVKKYLFKIDPDLDHDSWIRAGFFLRIVFYPKGLDQEAFALFDEWSASGHKYQEKRQHHDMLKVWEGFPTDGVMSSLGVLRNIEKEYPLTVNTKDN